MPLKENASRSDSLPPPQRAVVGILLLIVVGLGVGWRLTDITQWPTATHETRQYFGASLARKYWLRMRADELSPVEQNWLDRFTMKAVEPPVINYLAAVWYLVIGEEQPWIAGLISGLFWLAGGWFVFDAARRITSDLYGGVVALAFYLLAPFGIGLSRSFQPEAVMVFGFAVAIWWLIRRGYPKTLAAAVIDGLVCGLTMLLKPGITLLPVAATFAAIAGREIGPRRMLNSSRVYVFYFVMALPSLLYAKIFLAGHFSEKFQTTRLLDAAFYRGCWQQLDGVIGWYFCAAAIVGAVFMVRDNKSYVGAGLLTSYVAYCLLFTYHAETHSYYHLPAIVVVAICLGPLARPAREAYLAREFPTPVTALCVGVLAASMLYFSMPAALFIAPSDKVQGHVELSKLLRKICGDDASLIYLDRYNTYGRPLGFHSWLPISSWPTQADLDLERQTHGRSQGAAARLKGMLKRAARPTHFVVTNFYEFRQQNDLRELLNARFEKIAEGPAGIVYDLRRPRDSP